MQQRVRAIIIDGDTITLIKRVRDGKIYYVFPGGGVERGEGKLEALNREVKEELGTEIAIEKEVARMPYKRLGRVDMEHFYLCHTTGGTLGTGDGPEFQPDNDPRHGTYEIEQFPLSEIAGINLLPIEIRRQINNI